MGQFVGCVRGIAEACKALDFPVVSGNVSLYNETQGRGILPTPSIGGVGVLRRLHQVGDARLQGRGRGDPSDRRDAGLARPVALSARRLRPRGGRAAAGRSDRGARERRRRARADRRGARHRRPRRVRRRACWWRWPRWRWRPASAPMLDAAPEDTAGARLLVRRGSGALSGDGAGRSRRRGDAAGAGGERAGAPDRLDRRRHDRRFRASAPSPSRRWPSASKAGCRPIWPARPEPLLVHHPFADRAPQRTNGPGGRGCRSGGSSRRPARRLRLRRATSGSPATAATHCVAGRQKPPDRRAARRGSSS